MKKLLVSLLILAALSAQAAETVRVSVNGLVCSFCAQGIEKKFKAQPEVAAVKVDLDEKLLELTLKEGKALSDARIKALVEDAGYEIEGIKH